MSLVRHTIVALLMNSLISRSTALVAVAIASLLGATPARAQSDEREIIAAVTKFLDGIRTRDTSLMRSTVRKPWVVGSGPASRVGCRSADRMNAMMCQPRAAMSAIVDGGHRGPRKG